MMNNVNKISALTVAREILSQGAGRNIAFTPLKLMKLVYIAHGIKLAISDQPMFDDEVEAWKYGPVISDLYQQIKQFKNNPLPYTLFDQQDQNGNLDEMNRSIIEMVLDKWGSWTGPQLSTATHKANSPWYKTWHGEGGKYSFGTVIPNTEIKLHYKALLDLP